LALLLGRGVPPRAMKSATDTVNNHGFDGDLPTLTAVRSGALLQKRA